MALTFDGTQGDSIDTPKLNIASATLCTICAWIRFRGSNDDAFFSNWSNTSTHAGFLVRAQGSTGEVDFGYRDSAGALVSGITASALSTSGGWSHLVVRFDDVTDNELAVFIDGVKDSTVVATTNPMAATNSSSKFFFGATPHNSLAVLDGDTCEGVVFKGIKLSDEQIAALAGGASPLRLGIDLSANSESRYLPMFGNTSPEPDLSGNGQVGTVTGGVKSDHAPVGFLFQRGQNRPDLLPEQGSFTRILGDSQF